MDALVDRERLLFGNFRLEPRSGRLFRRDAAGDWVQLSIGSRAVDILRVLLDRPGTVVSKCAIMDAVWPDTAVEPNNLTVQIAGLRRVLDDDRDGASCIQTVPGRGYRLLLEVTPAAAKSDPRPVPVAKPAAAPQPRARPPRMSMVVLAFENLGDPGDDRLAAAITDDLTSDLTLSPIAVSVIVRKAADAYRGGDPRTVGEELNVRYVITGSLRRLGSALRVNLQLISGETGALLWSDRFDEPIEEPVAGQQQIVWRMFDELFTKLLEMESARSLREQPTDPDAFDCVLRAAHLIERQLPSLQRVAEATALLEQALALDPSSVYAMTRIAFYLNYAAWGDVDWRSFDSMQRTGRLLRRALTIAPDWPLALNAYVGWLAHVGCCAEAISLCERALQIRPNRARSMLNFYNILGKCRSWLGHAEEAIALEQEVNRLNPRSPWKFNRHRHIGWYCLLLGRDLDAISHLERSLAIHAEVDGYTHRYYRQLAAAYARTGKIAEARQSLARADRLWPYDTVRSRAPDLLQSQVYIDQYKRFQDALRLAGLRDHADEDADFGLPPDAELHGELAGPTPVEAPGTQTIRTSDLVRFLTDGQPIIIDTMIYTWGRSLPGAIGLKYAGLGNSFTDELQDLLRRKMRELTAGNLDHPIVAVGWNSERFDGRNLALRLVALGYTLVYWYRGGREAWEVAGLPETEVDLQEW
ncbi:MAG: winged helix-turn-helix domain-containing protein [Acetobacteraceae bacterium]|nr:winged helix-turn-helix domain-containing protein [Acetobacteraceae bacterium]